MKTILIAITALLILTQCTAADAGRLFEEYMWENRLLLVYAPEQDNPDLVQQNKWLQSAQDDLDDRDIVRFTFVHLTSVSVNGAYKPHLSTNPFYNHFDQDKDAFAIMLIGKDGGVKYQSDSPISIKALTDIIDAMPMRQREMKNSN